MECDDSSDNCSELSPSKRDSAVEYDNLKDLSTSASSKWKYKPSTIKQKFGHKKRKRAFQRKKLPDNAIPTESLVEPLDLSAMYALKR